jgi:phosphoribosylformimino-5-aminoimidazole carboxamide ribotide isomerase
MGIQIRPAIDLIDGKCVRLEKGDFQTAKVYPLTPRDQAKQWEDHGVTHLHLVDLDGARAGKFLQHKILEQIALETKLSVDVGGGMYGVEDLTKALEHGAQQVTLGSIAVDQPELAAAIIKAHGPESIILGMDVNNGKVMTKGWEAESGLLWQDFLNPYLALGIQYIISTDIKRDGMLTGPSLELYKAIQSTAPDSKVIASGGVSSIKDLVALMESNTYGVIIGKALLEGKITLKELSSFITMYTP